VEIGQTWLCEVWRMPPELACNGDGPRLEVMRYAGETTTDCRTRTIFCGGTRIQVTELPVMELWVPVPGSDLMPGETIWKIVPIRELSPDPMDEPMEERVKLLWGHDR
jgi:hypothetical protein